MAMAGVEQVGDVAAVSAVTPLGLSGPRDDPELSPNTPHWLGLPLSVTGDEVPVFEVLPSVDGVALLLPEPEGDPVPSGDLAALLARRQRGIALAERVRQIRRAVDPRIALGVALSGENIRPETSRGWCLDLNALVSDGTLDAVWLAGAPSWNLHRLRLLRPEPLTAGLLLRQRSAQEIRSDVRAALTNSSVDSLWLWDLPLDAPLPLIAEAIQAFEQSRRMEATVKENVASGKLIPALSVPAAKGDNLATTHGVGQLFQAAAGGRCRVVRLYTALRGSGEGLPPDLPVAIRPDADGRPGEQVLGQAVLSPAALRHEPSYRWGLAVFRDGPVLVKGQRYWVTVPDVKGYVWRMVSEGATDSTHAWSRRYDYGRHSWVLDVLVTPLEEHEP